jgi:hypothetical protein
MPNAEPNNPTSMESNNNNTIKYHVFKTKDKCSIWSNNTNIHIIFQAKQNINSKQTTSIIDKRNKSSYSFTA